MEINTKEIEVVKTQVSKAVIAAEKLEVKDDPSMLEAGEVRKKIKEVGKILKEKKEAITKPLNDALKQVRSLFAPIEANYEEAESIISNKMLSYQNKVEAEKRKIEAEAIRKLEEAQRKLEEGKITEKQVEKIEQKLETKLEQAPEPIKSSSYFHTRVDKKVKFSDPKTLTAEQKIKLVDEGYLVWDEVKGRRDALSGTLTTGVEVYEQKNII